MPELPSDGIQELAFRGAIAVFMQKAINSKPVEIWGDGSVIRDYIYIDDVVDALIRSLSYEGNEKLFNIGNGKGYSLNDILDSIEKVLDQKIKRTYSKGRICDIPVNVLDIQRAKEQFGWSPVVDLLDGLRKIPSYQ